MSVIEGYITGAIMGFNLGCIIGAVVFAWFRPQRPLANNPDEERGEHDEAEAGDGSAVE